MPRIQMTVKGADVVRKGLQDLRREVPRIARVNIEAAAERVAAKARKYPPEIAGQKYIRTYTLQGSVKVEKMKLGAAVSIDPVKRGRHYGKYVVGNARGGEQAEIHEGRWYPLTFAELFETEIRKLPKTIDTHLKRVTKSLNL